MGDIFLENFGLIGLLSQIVAFLSPFFLLHFFGKTEAFRKLDAFATKVAEDLADRGSFYEMLAMVVGVYLYIGYVLISFLIGVGAATLVSNELELIKMRLEFYQ